LHGCKAALLVACLHYCLYLEWADSALMNLSGMIYLQVFAF